MIKKNKAIKYNYNPFGGLKEDELEKVLKPKIDFVKVLEDIDKEDKVIVEFVGKKGRGKTMHLQRVNQMCESSKLFLLRSREGEFKEIMDCSESLILIDSIHHLNFLERIKLFKLKKKIILTTHFSRFFEYKIANVKWMGHRFRGINKDDLREIIDSRISLALDLNSSKEEVKIEDEMLDYLLEKYEDDYRAILTYLYKNFDF